MGTRVDADADRHASAGGGSSDLRDLVVELLDIAGVDADRGAAGVDGGEDVPGLEVNVGDDRKLRLRGDGGQRVGVVLAGDRDSHDLATSRGELGDLLQGGVDVAGAGGRHGLD
jgi:hypothetical protein